MADYVPARRPQLGESPEAYRERMVRLEAEALTARRKQIIEQRSPLNSASDRIRIWERRHQLPLPRTVDHPLLADIALDTGLVLEDVHVEQRARAASRTARQKE